jgi:tyramine---L-glutamate ligase
MRVFLYEALCAGGLPDSSLSGSLHAEGWAMLSALIEDFSLIPGVEVIWLARNEEKLEPFTGTPIGREKIERFITTREKEPYAFRKLASKADYTLVVAPEFGGFLHQRCSWVEEVGGRLLGPSSDAVRLTADKYGLANFLRGQAPNPPCLLARLGCGCSYPAVLKPRDGAGSQATILVNCEQELGQAILIARSEGWVGELLLQPYVPGLPCSISFLVGQKHIEPLLPTSQEITRNGRFQYQGGIVPLPRTLAQRAIGLGSRAVAAIPGLQGYVGVDLILGGGEDGALDQIMEINPRLTTSYVGLRALAKANLAEAMIQIVGGKPIKALEWDSGRLRFWPDGRVKRITESHQRRANRP